MAPNACQLAASSPLHHLLVQGVAHLFLSILRLNSKRDTRVVAIGKNAFDVLYMYYLLYDVVVGVTFTCQDPEQEGGKQISEQASEGSLQLTHPLSLLPAHRHSRTSQTLKQKFVLQAKTIVTPPDISGYKASNCTRGAAMAGNAAKKG